MLKNKAKMIFFINLFVRFIKLHDICKIEFAENAMEIPYLVRMLDEKTNINLMFLKNN